MSIISKYYRYYADVPYKHDFADVILEAISFVCERITAYWSEKDPHGGVDLSGLPGQEFGFQPMEVQVFRKAPLKKDAPPVVKVTTLLGDQRQQITIDEDYKLRMASKIDAMRRLSSETWKDEAVYRSFTTAIKPLADIYAISPAGITGSGRQNIPILYNLDLGELYYISLPIDINAKGKIVLRNVMGCVLGMNWITGKKFFIGSRVVDSGKDIPDYYMRDWLSPVSAQTIQNEMEERTRETIRNTHIVAVRAEKGARGGETSLPTTKKGIAEDRFPLSEDELIDIERKTEAEMAERDFHINLGPVAVMMEEEVNRLEDDYKTATSAFCEKEGLTPWAAHRHPGHPVKPSLPHEPSGPGFALCTTFLEHLYEISPNSLTKSMVDLVGGVARHASNGSAMSCFWNVLHFTGNLFQSVLQTTAKNSWFLTCLLFSTREGGRPLAKIDPDSKTINKWLGMTKPDYEKFLAQPTEALMVLFLLMNKIKPTSYKQAEQCYEKLKELNDVWLKEYDRAPARYAYGLRSELTTLKGKGNRMLFETFCLPQALALYTKHGLEKKYAPIQYVRYIIDEGRHGGGRDLETLEKLLVDYNRMAKEIVPEVGFTLPHNLPGAHDTMVLNYNRIKGEKMRGMGEGDDALAEEILQFAVCYNGKVADVCPDEKFTVVAPVNSGDLYEEGILLNHCVGSYGEDIIRARGSMLIFFLRARKHPRRPLVTIQVDRTPGGYEITEIAGKGNRLPTEEESDYSKRWLDAFNKAVAEVEKKRAKEEDAPAFKANILNWLSMLGAPLASTPIYNAAMPKEENYLTLFTWAAEQIQERKSKGDELGIAKKDFNHTLATLCASLRFSKTTFARFSHVFDFIWEKEKAAA